MSDEPRVVRSYQRLFRPDRRIYTIDGRSLPIPGGVPLAWVLTAIAIAVGVLLVSTRSPVPIAAVATAGGGWAWRLGRRRAALTVGAGLVVAQLLGGVLLSVADWPLRLVVLPAVAATGLMHPARDGRSALRYACGWLHVRVAGHRRSSCPVAAPGASGRAAGRVCVASDAHRPTLVNGAITGPAAVEARRPVLAVTDRRGGRRLYDASSRRGGVLIDELVVADGKRVEVQA